MPGRTLIKRQGLILLLVVLICSSLSPALEILAGGPGRAGVARASEPALQTPSSTPAAGEPPGGSVQYFRIGKETRSGQAALQDVTLELRRAGLISDELILDVAFKNVTSRQFSITGQVDPAFARLTDASGHFYPAHRLSPNLQQISPAGGFAPGAANVGQLVFPRPGGAEPYELHFLSYEPIQFRLDTSLPPESASDVPVGEYPLQARLNSAQSALAPIELQVQALRVATDSLTFQLGFVNTSRQGYDLLVGPKGGDAWLLDAEERQYQPVAVSDSIRDSIDPAEGWQPGQVHTGTITFPRPEAIQELRFIFPEYNALSLHLANTGVISAEVTAPTGEAPQPIPTPPPENRRFVELNQFLADQAAALLAGNTTAYLETFTPAMRPAQQVILERAGQMPLVSYDLAISPAADLAEDAPGRLEDVEVEVRYTLAGLPEDNAFLQTASFDFVQAADAWQVSQVKLLQNPPFWWTGDVTARTTDHFLIFARPTVVDQLPALAAEAEAAYQTLAQRGLPVAPRYAAYFTATQADFQELTGQPDRVVGAAAWRYNISQDTMEVSSRAFYINGEAFVDQRNRGLTGERQSTILHELVHLVLASDTRPFAPPWLTEGMAVYFAGQNTPVGRRQLLASGQLDSLNLAELTRAASLGEHEPAEVLTTAAYTYSGEVIRYLVEKFGEDQVLAFYRSYADLPVDRIRTEVPGFTLGSEARTADFANLSQQVTADAVQQFFGLSLVNLDAQVKAWLRGQG